MNLKNNPKLFSLSPPVQAGKAHPDFCGTNRLRELLILWMGCLIKSQLPPAFCQVNQTVHPFLVTLLLGEIIGAEGRAFLRPRKVSDDLGRGLPGVWHYFIISARPVPDLSPTCVAQGFILSQAWYCGRRSTRAKTQMVRAYLQATKTLTSSMLTIRPSWLAETFHFFPNTTILHNLTLAWIQRKQQQIMEQIMHWPSLKFS